MKYLVKCDPIQADDDGVLNTSIGPLLTGVYSLRKYDAGRYEVVTKDQAVVDAIVSMVGAENVEQIGD